MRFLMIIIILYAVTSNIVAQRTCFYKPNFFKTETFPSNPNILAFEDRLQWNDSLFVVNDTEYAIDFWVEEPFDNKEFVLKYYACLFDFRNYADNMTGEITTYTLKEDYQIYGDEITILRFMNCEKEVHFLLTSFGWYLLDNRIDFALNLDDYYKFVFSSGESKRYVAQVDTTAHFEIEFTNTQIYDHTETVLSGESYNDFLVSEAKFDTIIKIKEREWSDCSEAIMDTTYINLLVHDTYIKYIEVESVMETVTEQVLDTSFTQEIAYYKRESSDIELLKFIDNQTVIVDSVVGECNEFDFLSCLDYTITELQYDTIILFGAYPVCRVDYLAVGEICVDTTKMQSYNYETRQYDKLVSLAIIDSVEVPAQWISFTQIRIANKEDLDSLCIHTEIEPYQVILTTEQSSYVEIDIPATYEERSYTHVVRDLDYSIDLGDNIEVDSFYNTMSDSRELKKGNWNVLTPYFNDYCIYENIYNALVKLDKLDENAGIKSKIFYQSIIDFQIERNLKIGVIDIYLLKELRI